MNYFNKFPLVQYANNIVCNITARSIFSDETKNNWRNFHPYVIDDGDRVDNLSHLYYDNPGYSWLVWMSNDIIDPYYEYPLTDEELIDLAIKNVGSLAAAQKYIMYYETNGDTSEEKLTFSQYDALSSDYKKYYTPDDNLVYYIRDTEKKKLSTNKIINIAIESANGEFNRIGEKVFVNSNNYGFMTFSNSSVVTVKNVTGQFANNATVTGELSGATATVTQAIEIANTLAATEAAFWRPVSYYDMIKEENDRRKNIKLLDVRLAAKASTEIKRVMKL